MSQTSVLSLITEYAFGLDGLPVPGFYSDATWDMARAGVSSVVELIPVSRGTSTYRLPDDEAALYALFYDDVLLSVTGLQDLQAVNPLWRDLIGRPNSYVIQDESLHDVEIVPSPDQNARDFVFLFGSPMGHDFPERALGVVMSQRRDDLPQWLDVPMALSILAREYDRASDHQDMVFAKACREIGADLLSMVLG